MWDGGRQGILYRAFSQCTFSIALHISITPFVSGILRSQSQNVRIATIRLEANKTERKREKKRKMNFVPTTETVHTGCDPFYVLYIYVCIYTYIHMEKYGMCCRCVYGMYLYCNQIVEIVSIQYIWPIPCNSLYQAKKRIFLNKCPYVNFCTKIRKWTHVSAVVEPSAISHNFNVFFFRFVIEIKKEIKRFL